MIRVSDPEKVSDADGDAALRPWCHSASGQGRHAASWGRLTTPAEVSPPGRRKPKFFFFVRRTVGQSPNRETGSNGHSAQAGTRKVNPGSDHGQA